MTLRHFGWSHFSVPPRFKRWSGDFFFKQEFQMVDVQYEHEDDEDSDQEDWNKLTGVKDHFFSPKKQTLMVGWRWNPQDSNCEFNFYRHENWGVDRGPVELRCKEGETIVVTMWRNFIYSSGEVIVQMWIKERPETVVTSTIDITSAAFLVNLYFGGDRTPGKRIKIRVNSSNRFESNPYVNALGSYRQRDKGSSN